MKTRSGLLRAAVVTAIMSTLALAPATPAQAVAYGDYTGTGVRIRQCANTTCTVHGLGYPGQGATITCYRLGQYIGTSAYWYYHRNRTTGVVGYSHSNHLDFASGTVPRC
ncbi:MAG TPA: hypothetical protein VFH03_19705 [Actinoplanes sp.]|nr:hypothetical protein [Actinoplanes sp.]